MSWPPPEQLTGIVVREILEGPGLQGHLGTNYDISTQYELVVLILMAVLLPFWNYDISNQYNLVVLVLMAI